MTTLIYHEKQAAALCGRHALNNLLQGRYVDEIMLADIAHELDEVERQLMISNGTDTPEALNFIAQESGNVDESGNFSISVLREALRRVSGYDLSSLASDIETALQNPEQNEGYVLNLQEHWFTLRRIECAPSNQYLWFNLNSLLKSPEIISPFFLSAFLAQMRQEGYSIFAVKPLDSTVPNQHLPVPVFAIANDSPNAWHTVASIQNQSKTSGNGNTAFQARKLAADKARQQAENDPEFRYALEASLSEAGLSPYTGTKTNTNNNKRNAQDMMSEDDQLRLALEASLNDLSTENNSTNYNSTYTRAVKQPTHSSSSSSSTSANHSSSSSSSTISSTTNRGGIRTLASLHTNNDTNDDPKDEPGGTKAKSTITASTSTVHSWGQGNTIGSSLFTSSFPNSPSKHSDNDDADMDPELRAALQLSLMEQQHTVQPNESPLEAVARLQALLPPEPGAADTNNGEAIVVPNGATVCRIQIRLPPTVAPHDDVLKTHKTIQGSTSRQRKFYSTDSLLSVFHFAELCWLEAWIGEGTNKSTITSTTNGTNTVSSSSTTTTESSSVTSQASTTTPTTTTAATSPYPFRAYGLSLSLPSKLFVRKDYSPTINGTDIPTLEGAGLTPSAALNLRAL